MRVAVILNGISRHKSGFYRHVYPLLAHVARVDVWETRAPGHAAELARQAADEGYPCVLAAGGDGTLHQVLNGLRTSSHPGVPVLGVVPLGTGNDFARMMNLHLRKTNWEKCLTAPPRLIDLGEIRFGPGFRDTRYFINACSVGLGPEVVHRLVASSRAWGPFITYLLAIGQTFLTHRPQHLIVTTAAMTWSGKMRVAAIANGQAFGNQICIAPGASVTDAHLNTFIAGEVTLVDFLRFLRKLKNKKMVADPRLQYGTCTSVRLESSEALWLEAEGELVCQLPVQVHVMPAAQPFLGAV